MRDTTITIAVDGTTTVTGDIEAWCAAELDSGQAAAGWDAEQCRRRASWNAWCDQYAAEALRRERQAP
jgi:hypothetical protein